MLENCLVQTAPPPDIRSFGAYVLQLVGCSLRLNSERVTLHTCSGVCQLLHILRNLCPLGGKM